MFVANYPTNLKELFDKDDTVTVHQPILYWNAWTFKWYFISFHESHDNCDMYSMVLIKLQSTEIRATTVPQKSNHAIPRFKSVSYRLLCHL